MNRSLKRLALSTHRIAARNPALARWYLRSFRLAKYLPDGSWKSYLLNSLQSIDWPDVAMPPARVELAPSVAVLIVPHMQEFDFAAHIRRQLIYETEVTSWLRGRQYDVVVEIGANVGIYTLLFSRMWPVARIFSFEPSRTAYRRLLENLSLNGCQNVYPFNCAVAAESGFLAFHEPDGHLTNGSLDRSFAAMFSDSVRSTTVAALSGNEIAQLIPDGAKVLLKIDVEGAEPVVVNSLERWIISATPDILIEVLPVTENALNNLDVFRSYRRFHLCSSGPVQRDFFVAGQNRDYALVPGEAAYADNRAIVLREAAPGVAR